MKLAPAEVGRVVVPTKSANARCLEMLCEAIRIAGANENTMPTLANVRKSLGAIPTSSPGAAFITAESLEGKKPPAPIAPTT